MLKKLASSALKSAAKSASKSMVKGSLLQSAGKSALKAATSKTAMNMAGRALGNAASNAVAGAAFGVGARMAMGGNDKRVYTPQPVGGAPVPPPPAPAPAPMQAPVATPQPQADLMDLSEFSPKMQMLLRAALEDGVITDSERNVLFRQAEKDGLDVDEFQMMLDAKLFRRQKMIQEEAAAQMAKLQQANMAPAMPATPGNTEAGQPKTGKIQHNTCPNCGALLESGSPICKECGFALNAASANSSAERLANLIMNLENKTRGMVANGLNGYTEENQAEEKASIIRNFPIPTDRANLLEFIISLKGRSQYSLIDKKPKKIVAKAYQQKREECLEKARLYFESDPQFQRIFAEEAEAKGKKKKFGLF